jgi:hypothetical protein
MDPVENVMAISPVTLKAQATRRLWINMPPNPSFCSSSQNETTERCMRNIFVIKAGG